jgi:hypothetical protein
VYCTGGTTRPKNFLTTQATRSQATVAGNAPPVTSDTRPNQSMKSPDAKITATPSITSTNNTARKTTPM